MTRTKPAPSSPDHKSDSNADVIRITRRRMQEMVAQGITRETLLSGPLEHHTIHSHRVRTKSSKPDLTATAEAQLLVPLVQQARSRSSTPASSTVYSPSSTAYSSSPSPSPSPSPMPLPFPPPSHAADDPWYTHISIITTGPNGEPLFRDIPCTLPELIAWYDGFYDRPAGSVSDAAAEADIRGYTLAAIAIIQGIGLEDVADYIGSLGDDVNAGLYLQTSP